MENILIVARTLTCIVCLNPAEEKVSTWPLEGLNGELNNIAYMESYYGKYVNHEPHARGPFHTAFGSLGLKPITAWWTYKQSPKLQKKFPGLQNEAVFLREFWRNRELYTQCANFHWWQLRHATPTLARAVYSWRWGLTASNEATDEQIANDAYTTKYAELTQRWTNARTISKR
jgi:hypothetical protein